MENFWEYDEWQTDDFHLKKLHAMPFNRPFPFFPDKPGLYIVRGPRQVGKSTWLKQILSENCKKTPCFYLSCENVADNKELQEILKSVRDRKIVLLDEVNFVKDWDRAIKHEVDRGTTNILMITGSHTYDLKRGADQMPGRFGYGGEFTLLPMDFDEFERMRDQAGWRSPDRVSELRAYFKIGGFPSALAEAGSSNRTPVKAMETYLRWLIGDIKKIGKQESLLKELLIQLSIVLQTPVSLNTLAKKTNFGSHNTVRDYLEVLEACFTIRTLFPVDIDSGAFRLKKDKKYYFTDPLLFWIAHTLSGKKDDDSFDEKIAEMVSHEALARKYSRFGYFSNEAGEIDFVLPKQWAIEVKWGLVPKNLSNAYKKIFFPQKTVWTHSNFLKDYPKES